MLDLPWSLTHLLIIKEFRDSPIKIIIHTNEVTTPPISDRPGIILENHATIVGGHKGVTKTLNRIKHRYSWPGMKSDVCVYIGNCRDCQLKKLVRLKTKQPMTLTDTPGAAFEKVSMDIMGLLPTTRDGYNYILTIQDLLTKYSLAIPLKQATSTCIADGFIDEFICTFGTPKVILTDQGKNFVGSLMRLVARKFRIKQCKTTAYRPQSNGSIERSHHTLWEFLKQFAKKHNWNKYLKLGSFSYNTSVHEGTHYTPHELVFGKVAEAPASDPPLDTVANETYCNYLTTLFNKLKYVQSTARKNLITAKERSKHYYDRKINPGNFGAGDYVYLLKEPKKGKLEDQYIGPYIILEILDSSNVKRNK